MLLSLFETGAELKKAPDLNNEADVDLLVKKAQEGDNEAFGELVGVFEKFIYHTAYRLLSSSSANTDAADDVTQAAFIKAWRSLSSFRGECTFSTWLYRITVNTARDCIRKMGKNKTISLTASDDDDEEHEWDVPVLSGDTVPEDALDKKELILAVRRAIEELPEEQRTVVVMRDIHELPYHTISEALGIELGTVKSRLYRGRLNLKNILEKSGTFPPERSSK